MRKVLNEYTVIEHIEELCDVCFELSETKPCQHILFDMIHTPANLMIPDDLQNSAKEAFDRAWSDVPFAVRSDVTKLAATTEHSIVTDNKIAALVCDAEYIPAVAFAMGLAKRAKLMRANKIHNQPLVYLSCWDITVMALKPSSSTCGLGGWKLSERGYVCTEDQATAIATKELRGRMSDFFASVLDKK